MEPNSARTIRVSFTVLGWLALACAFPSQAEAQINCANPLGWSITQPLVNQDHVFCGEWDANRAKGFHSRPGGVNPTSVATFIVTLPPSPQGIYGGTWTYVGHPQNPKASTMFPDTCSQAQVLKSILHANANRTPCPPGAPNWAWCGLSRPAAGEVGQYCDGADGTVFTIAGANLANGNINTAFPLR